MLQRLASLAEGKVEEPEEEPAPSSVNPLKALL